MKQRRSKKLRKSSPPRRRQRKLRLLWKLPRSSRNTRLSSSSRTRSSSTRKLMISLARRRKPECKLRRISRMSRQLKRLLKALSAKKRKKNKRFSKLWIRRPRTMRSPSTPSRKLSPLTRRNRKWWSRSTWRSRRPRRIWSSNWKPRRRRLPNLKELTRRRVRPRSKSPKCQRPPPTAVPPTSTYRASPVPQLPRHRPPMCPSTWRLLQRTDKFRMWSRCRTRIISLRPRSRLLSYLQLRCPNLSKAKRTQLESDSTSKISRFLPLPRNERMRGSILKC